MFSLFGRKNVVKPDGTLGQPEGEVSPLVIHGKGTINAARTDEQTG